MQHFLLKLLIAVAIAAVFPVTARTEAMCAVNLPAIEQVHAAIRLHKVRDLSACLRDPASLDVVDPETGNRPLMTALIWGKPKHFRELLRKGANPDLTNRTGNTALHVAAQINAPGRVLELLQAGANPRTLNNQHRSFQIYLFMAPETLLSARNRKERAAVIAWLKANGVELESATGD